MARGVGEVFFYVGVTSQRGHRCSRLSLSLSSTSLSATVTKVSAEFY